MLAKVERTAERELLRWGLPYPHLKETFTFGERNPDVTEACGHGVLEATG